MAFNMIIFWLVALAIFLIAEAVTASLVSMWFALGALGALLVAIINEHLIFTQILTFIVVSAVTLYFTRPVAKKYFNSKIKRTNADRVLDMTGIVEEEIDNIAGIGSVYIGGKHWAARSADGAAIPKDTLISVLEIEGVKLIVSKKADEPYTADGILDEEKQKEDRRERI